MPRPSGKGKSAAVHARQRRVVHPAGLGAAPRQGGQVAAVLGKPTAIIHAALIVTAMVLRANDGYEAMMIGELI
jgi:hypothetical protein